MWAEASSRRGQGAVFVVGLALASATLAAPSEAAAQEAPFQSYEAGAWYLTTFELTLLAELPLSLALGAAAGESLGEAFLCGLVLPICLLASSNSLRDGFLATLVFAAVVVLDVLALLIVPPVFAAVADGEDWPVDFPVAFTTGLSSGISLGLLGGAVTSLFDAPAVGALAGMALGIAGGLTYSILRIDELARDPRVGIETNFLMWAPALLGPIALLVAGAAGLDGELVALIGGAVGALAIGASILAIEIALSEPAAPAPGPLVVNGPAVEF